MLAAGGQLFAIAPNGPTGGPPQTSGSQPADQSSLLFRAAADAVSRPGTTPAASSGQHGKRKPEVAVHETRNIVAATAATKQQLAIATDDPTVLPKSLAKKPMASSEPMRPGATLRILPDSKTVPLPARAAMPVANRDKKDEPKTATAKPEIVRNELPPLGTRLESLQTAYAPRPLHAPKLNVILTPVDPSKTVASNSPAEPEKNVRPRRPNRFRPLPIALA